MAGVNPHRAPSAGAVIKKVLEINPELGVQELTALIRQAMRRQGGPSAEFSDVEVIDEDAALRLARESLRPS